MPRFEAMRATRTHTIRLEGPPGEVFPLFEPLGEKKWVAGWDPEFLYPRSGAAEEGAVFLTRAEGEPATIWTILEHRPEELRVAYARITPESRAGRVEVRCRPDEAGRTLAEVTYTFTALSEQGNTFVGGYTEEHHRGYIESWATAINRYLREERAPEPGPGGRRSPDPFA